jgi:DNA polymerase I-like protein with 3'-5' exonuclease and polymerase domains
LFVAEPGCVLVELDYSAIEAVLVGYFAGSRDYVRLAKLGVHDYLLSHMMVREKRLEKPADLAWSDADLRMFLKDVKARFKDDRDRAKHIVHMSNYGATPSRIQANYPESFGSIRAASDLQRLYFEVCPEIKRWQTRTVDQAAERAYLRNPFGYRHWFWNVKVWKKIGGQWESEWGEDAKAALAFLPQSTAAAIIKEAMLRIKAAGLAAYLRLQVHDSLVCQIPEARVKTIGGAIYRLMIEPSKELPLDPSWGMGAYLSIGAEAKAGPNWGQMKVVEL